MKVVKAETLISFADDMEETLEILLSEFSIDDPRRQKIEQALRRLREQVNVIREQL